MFPVSNISSLGTYSKQVLGNDGKGTLTEQQTVWGGVSCRNSGAISSSLSDGNSSAAIY